MNDAAPAGHFERSDLFTDRIESAYLLTVPDLALAAFLDRHLDRFSVVPSRTAARQLTTLYFDTKEHALARRSGVVKLRVREYADAEPCSRSRPEPLLWIELKVRTGSHTHKQRFAVPNEELHEVLGGDLAGLVSENLPEAKQLFLLLGYTLDELRPSCATRYRRRAWQDPAGSLRITLDTELGFYRAPVGQGVGSSLADMLTEAAVAEFGLGVVEIKHQRELPRWLIELIPGRLKSTYGDGCPFSKFLAATRAIHGPSEPTA